LQRLGITSGRKSGPGYLRDGTERGGCLSGSTSETKNHDYSDDLLKLAKGTQDMSSRREREGTRLARMLLTGQHSCERSPTSPYRWFYRLVEQQKHAFWSAGEAMALDGVIAGRWL
jgi:hypothetical protein